MEAQLQASQFFKRFIGLELSGPHSKKTSLLVLDYYPQQKRLAISQVFANLGVQDELSSDEHLCQSINQLLKEIPSTQVFGLCTQAPLSLPPFFCSPVQRKNEERWMNELRNKIKSKPHPFVCYLNRPSDVWLRYFTPERFQVSEAFGSNLAPLAARLQALKEKFDTTLFENHPRSSFHRIVHSLGFSKFWPQQYCDVEKGLQIRQRFVENVFQKIPQFFAYEGDLETIILEISTFHSFVSALTLFLEFSHQCDSKPQSFPETATWPLLPRQLIRWDEIFKNTSTKY